MITQYGLRLNPDDDGHPYLVKEQMIEYAMDSFTNPEAIVEMCNSCFHLDVMAEEYLMMVAMDSAGHPLGVFELSHGTVRETAVGVREIFIRILLCGGVSAVFVIHNHPSGSPEPSREDKAVCRRLNEAAKLMGVVILDFIIIGREDYLSFKQADLL